MHVVCDNSMARHISDNQKFLWNNSRDLFKLLQKLSTTKILNGSEDYNVINVKIAIEKIESKMSCTLLTWRHIFF